MTKEVTTFSSLVVIGLGVVEMYQIQFVTWSRMVLSSKSQATLWMMAPAPQPWQFC